MIGEDRVWLKFEAIDVGWAMARAHCMSEKSVFNLELINRMGNTSACRRPY